jgi:threonine aldolase
MDQISNQPTRNFASDNNAGVHPEILAALAQANQGHVVAYGADPHTHSAIKKFEEHFGPDIAVFFTFNGTGANVLGLQALTRSFQSVLCSAYAHIYTDECGAPEKHTGCKLIPLPQEDGKITLDSVRHAHHGIGDEHHSQPRVISITQSTEMGTVYRPEEIRALAEFAHEHDMFLHMDGARIANAAASLGQTLRAATRDLGVDVLSFGGTKNGILGGEAVVFFQPGLSDNFLYLRKQGMLHRRAVRSSAHQRSLEAQCRTCQPHGPLAGKRSEPHPRCKSCMESRSERRVRADSTPLYRKNQAALLFLHVDGRRIDRAMDVFVRHDGGRHPRIREGGCGGGEGMMNIIQLRY